MGINEKPMSMSKNDVMSFLVGDFHFINSNNTPIKRMILMNKTGKLPQKQYSLKVDKG